MDDGVAVGTPFNEKFPAQRPGSLINRARREFPDVRPTIDHIIPDFQ
jgi:hypothetical protein